LSLVLPGRFGSLRRRRLQEAGRQMVAGAGPRSLPGVVSLTMPGGRLQRILAELSAGGQGWSAARLCGGARGSPG
jgi:hypothetical protein